MSTRAKRRVLWSLVIVGLTGGAVALWRWRSAPPIPRPARVSASPPRVLVRVGTREITSVDLARHEAIRRLIYGVSGDPEALSELRDRALLALAAEEHGIALVDGEVERELLRKQLIIAGSAMRPLGLNRPDPQLHERANQILAESGLTLQDLESEVRADALAHKVTQRLVFDQIQIANPRKDLAGAARPSQRIAERELALRLRRERGAPILAALMADLRRKWPVATQ